MTEELTGLELWGAFPDEAIARMLGDWQLFWKLMRDFKNSRDVDLLSLLTRQGEYANAFQVAHSMKGSAVTLGLTPLADALSVMVEQLRPYSTTSGADTPGEQETGRLERTLEIVEQRWGEFELLV